jgi:hypothetical protein
VVGKEHDEKPCIMLKELKRFVDFEGTWVDEEKEGGVVYVKLGIYSKGMDWKGKCQRDILDIKSNQ